MEPNLFWRIQSTFDLRLYFLPTLRFLKISTEILNKNHLRTKSGETEGLGLFYENLPVFRFLQ